MGGLARIVWLAVVGPDLRTVTSSCAVTAEPDAVPRTPSMRAFWPIARHLQRSPARPYPRSSWTEYIFVGYAVAAGGRLARWGDARDRRLRRRHRPEFTLRRAASPLIGRFLEIEVVAQFVA